MFWGTFTEMNVGDNTKNGGELFTALLCFESFLWGGITPTGQLGITQALQKAINLH